MSDQDNLSVLYGEDLSKFVVYGDLNCPFCFALHERFSAWNLLSRVEWRLIVHAPELSEAAFSLEDESLLANEVFAIHHRAPDVSVSLPKRRPGSSLATRLVMAISQYASDKAPELRLALYRALWQDGLDLSQPGVLESSLRKAGLEKFLDADSKAETNNGNPMERWEFWKLLGPEPKELVLWQNRWETDDAFDRRIPLIENTQTNALLLGLPSEEVLYQFLLSRRAHFVNDDVCVFQPRPVVMVFGWMEHLWSLVQIARESCEILHFSDLEACQQMVVENEDIDFLFIEHEFVDDDILKSLTTLARSRGLSWVLASKTAAEEVELRALNHGAEQYMSLDSSSSLHRARIDKLVSDRRRFVSMERDARVDGMTQIANRREFQFRLEQEWQRVLDRQDGSISLLLIDLDHFKPYNDHYGHLAGDACLKRAASVFKSSLERSSDLLARYGGEEFAVLVLDVSQDQAMQIAERLRGALLEDAIEHQASPVNEFVTASIGVARIDYGTRRSVGDLIKSADDGLYAAKGSGRNRVQVPPV